MLVAIFQEGYKSEESGKKSIKNRLNEITISLHLLRKNA